MSKTITFTTEQIQIINYALRLGQDSYRELQRLKDSGATVNEPDPFGTAETDFELAIFLAV